MHKLFGAPSDNLNTSRYHGLQIVSSLKTTSLAIATLVHCCNFTASTIFLHATVYYPMGMTKFTQVEVQERRVLKAGILWLGCGFELDGVELKILALVLSTLRMNSSPLPSSVSNLKCLSGMLQEPLTFDLSAVTLVPGLY